MLISLTRLIRTLGYIGAGGLGICVSFFGTQESALAQVCNVFGCSQPGAGACNPFGCPNPGAGECTPFGCPPSPDNDPSDKSSRSFTITNATNQAIQALFLSPSTEDSWGASDINSDLFSGNSVTFQLTGDCRWDLQVQLSNSQTIQEMGIDTCLNNNYSVGSGNSRDGDPNVSQPVRESFSQCVLDLYSGPYNSRDAANNCLQTFQGSRVVPSESFSQCVLGLYSGPYNSRDAANYCLQAFHANPANENLQSCISALYGGPYNSRDANTYCSQALRTS